jgi:hypothetical protein
MAYASLFMGVFGIDIQGATAQLHRTIIWIFGRENLTTQKSATGNHR